MAIYKPKLKKTTSTLDEVKFPSTVIDGLDKIAVRYEGNASTLKTAGVYSVSFERDGSLSNIKSSSYKNYDDVNSILIVGKSDDGNYFQMMFYDGKVYYRKAGESSNFPYYWSQGISLLESGGSGGVSDSTNVKVAYMSSLPSGFTGTFTVNLDHLSSSSYPIVEFDGIELVASSSSFYISKTSLLVANSQSNKSLVDATPFKVSLSSLSVTPGNYTVFENLRISLNITTNWLGSVSVRLIGRAMNSFTSYATSGSIAY